MTPNDRGALAILNIMGNKLGKEELQKFKDIKESKHLQSICGIASDATEANLSGLGMDAADAAILAEDIQDKGALAKLTWSGGDLWKDDDGKWKDPVPVTLDMDMTEADFSKKGLGAEGAIILAAFIKRKTFQDKGALSRLDIAGNSIGGEQEEKIKQICKEKSITCIC